MLRVVTGTGGRDSGLVRARDFGARHPTVASQLRFPSVQAAVDENPCEPYFEWPRLPIRSNVTEDLDEGVLDSFVGLGGISQVLISDARCPALVLGDEIGEPLARLVHLAALDQAADDDRQLRVVRQRRDGGASARGRLGNAGGVDWTVSDRPQITTHKGITMRVGGRLQFNV